MSCNLSCDTFQTNLHHLLSLQGLDLSGPALAVAVPVAQLAVVAIAPAEHLAALRQSHGVTVATTRRHQLGHHETRGPNRTGLQNTDYKMYKTESKTESKKGEGMNKYVHNLSR